MHYPKRNPRHTPRHNPRPNTRHNPKHSPKHNPKHNPIKSIPGCLILTIWRCLHLVSHRTLTVGPEVDVINLDALLPNGEWDITKTEANVYRYPSTYR